MRNRFQTLEKMEFDLCYLQRYEKCIVRFLIGFDTITFTFKIRFVPFFWHVEKYACHLNLAKGKK